MKTVKNAGAGATLALATLLLASFDTAAAAAGQTELRDCLGHAEQRLGLISRDVSVNGAEVFQLSNQRQMIAIDVELTQASMPIRPRLYCTIEASGAVSLVQTMPRLPQRTPATMVVSK